MKRRVYQDLPRFKDRWSYLYLEHGRLERTDHGLAFVDEKGGVVQIPLGQFALIMLGPGTTVTHEAIKLAADASTMLAWCGEEGVRLYAHSTGGTHLSTRLLQQAEAWADPSRRLGVIFRLYEKRFEEALPRDATIEQVRGLEGQRVRAAYRRASEQFGVPWEGRSYDPGKWDRADPVNRALSTANACLYGLCHAAIVMAGYSPGIGFIHTGKQLSFVYDVADLYKTEITVPIAFQVVKAGNHDIERRTRIACRDRFHDSDLASRILPDIAEVLGVGDDPGESADELEGRIISLADRAEVGRLPGESKRADPGRAVGEGNP